MTKLAKGARVALDDGDQTALVVEATWDPGPTNADLVIFVCTSAGTVVSQEHLVYFNNKVSPDRAVFLVEDYAGGVNRGAQAMLDVTALPPEAERIDVVLVAPMTGQTLQPVTDIRLDIWDPADGRLLTSFLVSDGGLCNCLALGRLYKHQGQWKFWAMGEKYPKDFASQVREYGIAVSS